MTTEEGANKRAFPKGSHEISISKVYVCFDQAVLLNVLLRKAVTLELDSWPKCVLRIKAEK